jgi:hypothetical protein
MQVFVSYSFDESADKLTNVIAALHAHRIRFWHHSRAIAGRPLVQELRRGIAQSSACVYVATKKSLQSDWCKAEVGAFWAPVHRSFLTHRPARSR